MTRSNIAIVAIFCLSLTMPVWSEPNKIATSNGVAPHCPRGLQPYGERCVTQDMADLISCVEANGGNRERIEQIVNNGDSKKGSLSAKGSGKGFVASGSGSLALEGSEENDVATRVVVTWFPSGNSICSTYLDVLRKRSLGTSNEIVSHLKNIDENTPRIAYPVVEFSRPVDEQVHVFASDQIQIVGLGTNALATIRCGDAKRNLPAMDEEIERVRVTCWGQKDALMKLEFLDTDGHPLNNGAAKLQIEYRSHFEDPRIVGHHANFKK